LASDREKSSRLRAQAMVEIARTNFNNGRFETSLEYAEQAIAADPTLLRAHIAKAHALKMLGRAEESLAECDRVIAIDPNYPLAHSTRGSALQSLNRKVEAQAAYDRALAIDPDNALVHYNFACFWAMEGDAARCRVHLRRAIEIDPRQNTMASVDKDFESVRDEPWFQELVAFRK